MEEEYFGQYLLENCFLDYEMLRYLPSMLAAASVNLVLKVMREGRGNIWKITGYTEQTLKAASKDILILAQSTTSLKGIRHKFSSEKFKKVALTKL